MSWFSQEHFINVFVSAADKLTLQELRQDKLGSRQKKPHCKSRNGCLTCKERRVKCDENYPSCHRCVKRGDICRRRPIRQQQYIKRPQGEEPSSVPSSISIPIKSKDEPLNIEQLKLFHHFQTSTHHTLPFIGPLWEHAIPMAFEYEYLMHAALCLSARHLDYLYPGDERKNLQLSRKHLSHALGLYRTALSSPITDDNQDAILCTSLLLYFEAWSDTEILPSDADVSDIYNISEDQLYTFSKGMKHVCSNAIPPPSTGKLRLLHDLVRYRPIHSIQNVLSSLGRDGHRYLPFFEDLFNQQDPVISQDFCELPSATNTQGDNLLRELDASMMYRPLGTYEAYMDVARRLSILLALLPRDITEASVLETHPDLLPDIARVVYSFPVLFHPTLINMLSDNDPRFLVLLYHFYRMVGRLLPRNECWWAVRRAESSEKFLKQKLWPVS